MKDKMFVNDINIKNSQRFKSYDFLKFFCAFFVVCLHVPFPGIWGNVFNSAVCRIAIPIFFMITGFFYTNTKEKGREIKQIIKILWYILAATLISFTMRIVVNIYKGTIVDYLKSFLSHKVWLNLLLFNESPFGAHIWYLNAILYVLLIVFFVEKLFNRKYLYYLIPFLLIGALILGSYSLPLFNREFDTYTYRNFFFIGLPFFLIGDFIYIHKDIIINIFRGYRIIIPISLLVVSLTFGIIEAYYLRYYYSYDLYITTIVSSILSIGVSLMVRDDVFGRCKLLNVISKCGRFYSPLIYILQIVFISASSFVSAKLNNNFIYECLAPFIVFALTLIVSIVAKMVLTRFIKRENNNVCQ